MEQEKRCDKQNQYKREYQGCLFIQIFNIGQETADKDKARPEIHNAGPEAHIVAYDYVAVIVFYKDYKDIGVRRAGKIMPSEIKEE